MKFLSALLHMTSYRNEASRSMIRTAF